MQVRLPRRQAEAPATTSPPLCDVQPRPLFRRLNRSSTDLNCRRPQVLSVRAQRWARLCARGQRARTPSSSLRQQWHPGPARAVWASAPLARAASRSGGRSVHWDAHLESCCREIARQQPRQGRGKRAASEQAAGRRCVKNTHTHKRCACSAPSRLGFRAVGLCKSHDKRNECARHTLE